MADVMDFSDFDSPEDLQGFDAPPKPGYYHLVVDEADASRQSKQGLALKLRVLAGAVEGQEGKVADCVLFDPKADSKDGGKFARKAFAKLAIATGMITPAQLGQRVSIDWTSMIGRQLIAKIEEREYEYEKDGVMVKGKGVRIEGLHMYSVIDPEVNHVPKCQKSLAALGIKPGTQQTAPPAQQQQTAPPAQQQAPPVNAYAGL